MSRTGIHIIGIFLAGFGMVLNSMAQPDWTVTTDAYRQTIVIGSEIFTSDSAVILEDGDMLGVFFADERNSVCGGKLIWGTENADNALTIFNNTLIDTKTNADDDLYFKVWKKSQNCILDSVKGYFRARTDTSAAITTKDTLNIYNLSGKPFQAGYTYTQLCNDQGIILPKSAPAEYKLTYRSDSFPVDAATGEINLTGGFSGNLEIQFTSDYCLASASQNLSILPAPEISFPAETTYCEGIDVNEALGQYVTQLSTDSDTVRISEMSRNVVVPDSTFDYTIRLGIGNCYTNRTVRVNVFPKPVIQWEREDLCDSVRIRLLNEEGSIEWSTGSNQHQISLSSDERITVKLTGKNECFSSETMDIQVRKMTIETFDAEEVNADCYTSGKISLRDSNVINNVGNYELRLENLITGETVPYDGLLKEGRYRVFAVDKRNCIAPWPKELIILKDCLNDNPVFSPNSDGMDDDFYIPYEGMVYIYNKNGRLIHQFQGPSYWDGTDERGSKLPLGIYLLVTGSEAKTITVLR